MPDRRLRPGERLRDGAAFDRVFRRAARSKDRFFTVLARPGGSGATRLGMAISRRVDKRAVARNRIKRLVRESFRHHKDRLDGLDLVVLARRECVVADNAELFASLENHWHRLSRCARS